MTRLGKFARFPLKIGRREISLDLTVSLPMNAHRERGLLTPTLSSPSMWKRGRWNGARWFLGSMREILRRILSQEGTIQRLAGRIRPYPTKSNLRDGAQGESDQIRPNQTSCGRASAQWPVVSGQWPEQHGCYEAGSNPVTPFRGSPRGFPGQGKERTNGDEVRLFDEFLLAAGWNAAARCPP